MVGQRLKSNHTMAMVILTVAIVFGCDDRKAPTGDTAVPVAGTEGSQAPGLYPEFERQERVERIAALTADGGAGTAAFEACATCHGDGGFGSPDGSIPRLAGQQRKVLIEKLVEISEGIRHRPDMEPYLSRIDTDGEIGALANYISSMPDPETVLHGDGDETNDGKKLYADYCASCHGMRGEGDGEERLPRIAGWNYDSVRRTLIRYQAGEAEVHETGMSDLVSMLTKGEIDTLADYVSRLTLREPASLP